MVLPDIIGDNEVTSYFLHFSDQFRNGNVVFSTFFPRVDLNPHQLSVFRIDELTEPDIWNLGNEHVPVRSGNPIKGRADLKALHFRAQNIHIEKDEPPPRHANILGWPEPRPDQTGKSKNQIARETWQEIATYLARNATFEPRPR